MIRATTKPREDNASNCFFSSETERWLAGGIVLYGEERPDFVRELFEIITPKRFTDPRIRAVAETAAELSLTTASGSFSAVELLRAAKASGKLPPQENAALLMASLAEAAAAHIGPETTLREAEIYARQIRKQEAAERLALLVPELRNHASRPLEILAGEVREVLAGLENAPAKAETDIAAQLGDYLRELEENSGIRPVKSPWRELNGILRGGVLPGELAILAARPSVGKSAFALNFAYSVAASGQAALFFSLEMSLKQLLDRLCANVAGVDVGAFREGLNTQERARVQTAARHIGLQPLTINDSARLTLSMMRRKIRAVQKKRRVGLVVVDYLQLVTPEERNPSREREVAEISRGMKLMAKEFQVPVLLLAQLNRKSEEMKREPMLSDLRESGAIEQDADIVAFLHTERMAKQPDAVKIIVSKGRSSGLGRASLVFRRRFQRFEDFSEDALEYQHSWQATEQDRPV